MCISRITSVVSLFKRTPPENMRNVCSGKMFCSAVSPTCAAASLSRVTGGCRSLPTAAFKNSVLNIIWIMAACWSGEALPSFLYSVLLLVISPPPGLFWECSALPRHARTHSFRPLDLGCHASSSKGLRQSFSVSLWRVPQVQQAPGPPVCCVCVCVMMINTFVLEASRELLRVCISV